MNINEQTRKELAVSKQYRETLPSQNHIVSIENLTSVPEMRGGRMFTVDAGRAGECLSVRTHRLATSEEIDSYNKEQADRKIAIQKEFDDSQHRLQIHNHIVLSKDDLDAVASGGSVPAAPAKKK